MNFLKGMVVAFALLLCPIITFADVLPNDKVVCLAANIYHEARGEPLLGQYMVAFVTMNRVKSPDYPNTICGVVKDPDQFSWYPRKKIFPKDVTTDKAWKRAIKIALQFIYDPESVAKDPTKGALWYHAHYVNPSWRNRFEVAAVVGNHIFYK